MSVWNVALPDAEWISPRPPEELKRLGQASTWRFDPEPTIRELLDQEIVAIDTETTGLNIVKDIPLYWSMAWGDPARCVKERRICMPADTIHHFAEVFADRKKKWLFANAKYDMHMMANVGIHMVGDCIDTQTMHALIYEERSHKLKDMAKEILGWGWTDFKETFGISEKGDGVIQQALINAEMTNLSKLVEYASNDAYGTLHIFHALKKELEGIKTFSLYPNEFNTMGDIFFKTEMPYTRVLWKCERNGIKINAPYLASIAGPVQKELESIEREIVKHAGRMLNPNSAPQMVQYFIHECGLRPLQMTKGGKTGVKKPSVDANFLEHYAATNPVADLMLKFRELDKLKGTYIDGLSSRMDQHDRIHTRFNQDVARTGRLSCVAAWTELKTVRGSIPIQQVKEGDYVWSHRGRWRRVLDCFTKGIEEMYDVRLSNGEVLTCTTAHKLLMVDGRWVSVGEIVDEHLERMDGGQGESEEGSVSLPTGRSSDHGEDLGSTRDLLPQRLPCAEDLHAGCGEKSPITTPVLSIEVRQQEPNEGEVWYRASQLEGGSIRRVRVSDLPPRGGEAVYPSGGDGQGRGAKETPRVIGCSSHRWRPRQQRAGQPSSSNEGGSSNHSLFAGEGLPVVTIEEVIYRGRLEVHDLTVEEDSSYEACGVFSHNSSDPNLQNIPTLENDKFQIRKAFIAPDDDHELIVVDYEALEMRLLASATVGCTGYPDGARDMIQIFLDKRDIHMGNAALVMGKRHGVTYDEIVAAKKMDKAVKEGKEPESNLTPRMLQCLKWRAQVKNIAFGLNYGMKENKLARDLGISKEDALKLMDEYMQTHPAVKAFFEEAVRETEMTGFSYTIIGRRRFHPAIHSNNKMDRFEEQRKATNNQIQGSAADVVRFAMLNCDVRQLEYHHGCKMLLQVHDELVFECPKSEVKAAKAEIKEAMEHPFWTDQAVPLTVSVGSGPNWGSAK